MDRRDSEEKRRAILQFYLKYIAEHGHAPSVARTQRELKMSSKSVVFYHVHELRRMGLLPGPGAAEVPLPIVHDELRAVLDAAAYLARERAGATTAQRPLMVADDRGVVHAAGTQTVLLIPSEVVDLVIRSADTLRDAMLKAALDNSARPPV